MKQTNNAIKFLMAQYRAIFKNANIAMLAAIAASALAAGQAQAGSFDNTAANKAETNVEVTIDGTGSTDTTYDKIALSDGLNSEKAYDITVTGGADENKINGNVSLANSTITVKGAAKANAKLDIGSTAGKATVLAVKELSVGDQGELNIAGNGDDKPASVTAQILKFGDGGADAKNSSVTVGANATVTATGDGVNTGTITINKAAVTVEDKGALKGNLITLTDGTVTNKGTVSGSNINISGGTFDNQKTLTAGTLTLGGGTLTATKAITANDLTVSKGTLTATEAVTASNELNIAGGKVNATKAVSGKTIKVTGGEVDFAAATGVLGSDTTDLITISGGTVGATTADGTIKGKSIKFEKGDIKATNALTIDGGFEATGGTITVADSQTLTFKGNASIADAVTITLDGTAKHTIKVEGTDAENNGKLSVSSTVFDKLTEAGKGTNKVALSGAQSSTAELHFTDDAAVNLETLGILTTAGALGTKIDISGNAGKVKVSAKEEATFAQKDLTAGITIAAKKLTVGNKANGFSISGAGAALEVGNVLTIGEGTQELKITEGSVSLKADAGVSGSEVKASKITVGSSGDSKKGTLDVSAGEWKIGSLVIDSGTATVINDAVLKITGDLTTKNGTNQLVAEDSAIIDASGVGKLTLAGEGAALKNTSTLILSKDDVFDKSGDRIDANYAENAVTGDANTTIKIMDGEKLAEMTLAKFNAFNDKAGFNGLWAVKISDIADNIKTEMNIGGTDNNVQAGLAVGFENTQAKVDGTTAIDKNYSVGSVALTKGDNLTVGKGAMTLQNANAHDKDGMFVSKLGANPTDKATLAGVNFGTTSTADSSLTLQGSGTIGAITTGAAGSGSVTFGAQDKTGDVTVKGEIGADTNEIGKLVNNGSTVSVVNGDVFVHEIDLNGGSFTVAEGKKLVLGDGQTFADSGEGLASTIDGNLKAGELTFKASTTGSVDIAGNAVVDLGTLRGITGIEINVGNDTDQVSGSATLLADKLELAEATLNIDPAYTLPYASAIVQDLSGASGDTLDGHVNVGNNALFAVGFDTKAEVDAVLGSLIKDGHFTKPDEQVPGLGARSSVTVPDANVVVSPNAVVLNQAIKLGGKGGIYVGTGAPSATDNTLKVDAGSALVITDKAFNVNPTTGKKTGAAISGSSSTATIADGAKLVLVGAFNGADNELEILSGFTSQDTALQNFKVSIGGSDLLEATWTTGGKLDVNLTQNEAKLASAFAGASTPVKQLMLDMLDGTKFAFSTEAGYQLINELAMANNGAAADAAAHAATYAGAQQAAVASVTTMADAMFGRVGAVGVEAASIAATGSQANGGVWLTPMYKSVDSEGFNAQGASYGSDVDLSGVAFGADTVNGNMRFGAVFNIGSGDAEGKGNGNGLKDEFDYYGFGIYSAMGFGNFDLVGDASMTVISHEVEGHGLKGKADTTAVTMGVTGQYTVATPAVDVTPHLGARFIRLNTDSYDLVGEKGVVGTTDFDVQNVFSVPLGVTLSKAFVAGGWSLAPSADLTIAFNTGDTDAKSTTRFTGINQNLDLTAEVLDEVQYGLTVGLGAQYGAFGTSFGINYTGSDNTDAFGVNAQCRYMF